MGLSSLYLHMGSCAQGTGLADPVRHPSFCGATQLAGPKSLALKEWMQHRTGSGVREATQHSCVAPQSSKSPRSVCSLTPHRSLHVPPSILQDSEAATGGVRAKRMATTRTYDRFMNLLLSERNAVSRKLMLRRFTGRDRFPENILPKRFRRIRHESPDPGQEQ